MDHYFNERAPGQTPDALPFRIRLSNGLTRTDPTTFTAEEIADAGYVLAPERPEPDPGRRVVWDSGVWTQVPLPVPTLRSLSRFEFMGLLTPQERIALRQRAAAGDVVLADALEMLGLAAHVEVGHPLVTQMLGYVQSIGVMSAERREAFVAAMDAAAK
ncbi:MAG: hypothetical protein Q8T13_04850 [Acidobacteriota bacterium]|nr:hypothetical protein [Acidobacteriota bacterium]